MLIDPPHPNKDCRSVSLFHFLFLSVAVLCDTVAMQLASLSLSTHLTVVAGDSKICGGLEENIIRQGQSGGENCLVSHTLIATH